MSLLNNIKIIDLTRFVAGPHCTLVLSDLGAEIIKIEKPGKGDDLRIIGPKLLDTSLWAAVLNRGKKSVSLDLKTKIGREILLKLIKEADVLVENFRPGVMEKLKLGWKTIRKVNNKLVMARISGYGQNDTSTARQAFDATIQAETGFMKISGEEESPTMIGTVLLDYTTGLNTAIGILAALNKRNISGKGELIETSLVSSALSLSMGAVPDFFINKNNFGKNGNSDRYSSPSNTYKAKDGYIHIMAGSDDRFLNLAISMKKKELINNALYKDPEKRVENQHKIDKIVENWTKKKSIKYLGKVLSANSVPWGEVKTFSRFLKTKTAKRFLMNANLKNKKIKVPECAIKAPYVKSKKKQIIPVVGENNNDVLKELGYSLKNLEILKKKNILK
ncbi:MAG: CaiB/BaiF CoA-transferase family protein [Pseudomonadota bacterium]|nr:CaiB/BaiF CoA-transferase family protein [Pseudomonadota bacterium]